MDIEFSAVTIYAKDIDKTVSFYTHHFDFTASDQSEEKFIVLDHASSNFRIFVHKAGKGVNQGQACMKLVFVVKDVEGFKQKSLKSGLKFGSTHRGPGYEMANAKDPNGNSVQISSRVFKQNE